MKNYSSVLIIYNPNAKKGKIDEVLPYIKERLVVRYPIVDMVATPKTGAEELAKKFAGKYDILISCGGDGTLHQVINGVIKTEYRPLVGVLPFGTCNDVSRTLHISKKLDDAIDCILRQNTTFYDVMFDGEECAVYALATGYMTDTSYVASSRMKKIFGRLAYVFIALKELFKLKGLPITCTCDGEKIEGKFIYFMLMNGESTGGFRLNKGEDLANGHVKVVMIKKSKHIGCLMALIKMFMFGIKSIQKSKYVIVRDATKIKIVNHSNEPFTMDGEKAMFLRRNISIISDIKLIKK